MSKEPEAVTYRSGRTRRPLGAPAPAGTSAPRIVAAGLEAIPVRGHGAAEAVLDKLNRGIVIFDDDRRVHFLNEAALQQIRRSPGVAVVEGRIAFSEAAAQARFVTFLQNCRVSAGEPAGTAQASTVMKLAAGPGRAPYRVLLSSLPAPPGPSGAGHDPRHVLMIYEPHSGQVVCRRILTELYGLSEAEAAVTLLLFRGETLEGAAGLLHITINTAKTHLHHVFVKCEVHSQGELLQLLSLGPRTL